MGGLEFSNQADISLSQHQLSPEKSNFVSQDRNPNRVPAMPRVSLIALPERRYFRAQHGDNSIQELQAGFDELQSYMDRVCELPFDEVAVVAQEEEEVYDYVDVSEEEEEADFVEEIVPPSDAGSLDDGDEFTYESLAGTDRVEGMLSPLQFRPSQQTPFTSPKLDTIKNQRCHSTPMSEYTFISATLSSDIVTEADISITSKSFHKDTLSQSQASIEICIRKNKPRLSLDREEDRQLLTTLPPDILAWEYLLDGSQHQQLARNH